VHGCQQAEAHERRAGEAQGKPARRRNVPDREEDRDLAERREAPAQLAG
jgi:hypothetical protein